ncbi:MAG: capsular biosynthesis protein, partial [Bryobacteraceae bacterium]
MSRVHDALRRAGQIPDIDGTPVPPISTGPSSGVSPGVSLGQTVTHSLNLTTILSQIDEIPFNPAPESHLVDLHRPMETPSEEFRSLRTKLNHMQSISPLHTVVVTRASPAEGKSFTAMNLAIAESHLADNMVLIADFDLRRPTLHNLLQVDRSPGVSDYLLGEA